MVALLFFFSGLACTSLDDKSETDLSEKIFRNPSTEYRPLALWTGMNGHIDTAKLVYELEEMKDKGLRGAIIWDIGSLINPGDMIPDGPAYLGPESLNYISLALNTSHSLGLDLGISSASSWNSGGEWIGSKELLTTSDSVTGPSAMKLALKNPESSRGIAENCALLTLIAIPHNSAKGYDPKDAISITKTNVKSRFSERTHLLKSGLLGKTQVVFVKRNY